MADTLFMTCHICERVIVSETFEDGHKLAPSKAIRWHERVISHLRREHVRKVANERQ